MRNHVLALGVAGGLMTAAGLIGTLVTAAVLPALAQEMDFLKVDANGDQGFQRHPFRRRIRHRHRHLTISPPGLSPHIRAGRSGETMSSRSHPVEVSGCVQDHSVSFRKTNRTERFSVPTSDAEVMKGA